MTINFFENVFEKKKLFHQHLFSYTKISFGDLFYFVIIFEVLLLLWQLFNSEKRSKAFNQLLKKVTLFYFIYQCFWGMMYFQPSISDSLNQNPITITETKKITEYYIARVNTTRNQLITQLPNNNFVITDISNVQKEILEQQKQLPDFLPKKRVTGINCFKPSLSNKIMNYTGILGYYNPFTSEAQYNKNLPHTYIPYTLAHESAHQLGYAREQEANFIAYLLGINSANLELRYSTELHALKSLLNNLSAYDKSYVDTVINRLTIEVRNDLAQEKKFRDTHHSIVTDVMSFTNDLFLKSNQQKGSVTYSYFVELLVRYHRK